MSLHAAAMLTTLHFPSHFTFHVYNLSKDLSTPFWHLVDHSSSTSSKPSSPTPQPTLPHSVYLHLSWRSHSCQRFLCKNYGAPQDQPSQSWTKLQQPPKPAKIKLPLHFYCTPRLCFSFCLFDNKIIHFLLAFLHMLHDLLNIFKTLLLISVSIQFNFKVLYCSYCHKINTHKVMNDLNKILLNKK